MKTKKLLSLLLALLLTALAPCAYAESIFQILTPEQPTTDTGIIAPSYGAFAGVNPSSETLNTEGGIITTYTNVMEDDYNRFGSYLGKIGYKVVNQEKQGDQFAYVISDGNCEFITIYDQPNHTMTLIYPKGTQYAKNLFPGYQQITIGEEIELKKLGKFNFFECYIANICGYGGWFTIDKYGNVDKSKITLSNDPMLNFSFYNTTSHDISFGKWVNDLFTAKLVFVSDANKYEYQGDNYGRLYSVQLSKSEPNVNVVVTANLSNTSYTSTRHYTSAPIPSLTMMSGSVTFSAPITAATDFLCSQKGTLAIKIDFKSGEKYVIMLREDGTDRCTLYSELE